MAVTARYSVKITTEVNHWDSETDGVLTKESLINRLETMGYTCSVYQYPPGTVFKAHTHSVDKIDAVLSGRFCIEIHGNSHILGPGDWLEVPKETVHSARVIGEEAVISVDAVKA